MAFENLIIRETKKIAGIAIDGVITENTTRTMRMTSNPIESGDNVADHVIQEPMTYSLEGVITDTPLGLVGIQETISGVKDAVSGIFGKSDTTGQTRSQQVYFALVELMQNKALLVVETSLKRYDDLIMETLNVIQDKDKSRAVFFTATFRQALIVRNIGGGLLEENMTERVTKTSAANPINGGTAATALADVTTLSVIKTSMSSGFFGVG